MIKKSLIFFVIGGGSGGVRAARVAASKGMKVGLAEGWDLGGTCVLTEDVFQNYTLTFSFQRRFQFDEFFRWTLSRPVFSWKNWSVIKKKR